MYKQILSQEVKMTNQVNKLHLPEGAVFVKLTKDRHGVFYAWFIVDQWQDGMRYVQREYMFVAGAGGSFDEDLWEYKGLYQDGDWIWHVIESKNEQLIAEVSEIR